MVRLSQLMPPLSNSNVSPKAHWELWLSRTAPRLTSANTPPNAMVKRKKLPSTKLLHSSARSLMSKVTRVILPSSNAESSQDHTFHGSKMARRSTRLTSGILLFWPMKNYRKYTGNQLLCLTSDFDLSKSLSLIPYQTIHFCMQFITVE